MDALHGAVRRGPGAQFRHAPPGARAQARCECRGSAWTRLRRGAVALALLALGLFGAADDLRAQEAPRAIRVVVAVLPFEVHSARSLGYLEESLADLLATRLEASGRIEVVEALTVREALVAYPGERSEQRVRRLAAQLKAEWVVVGSLTELAGQYSLDVRVTPAGSRFSSTALSFAAGGDDELLDRIDELAGRVLTLVTGGAEQLRVAALEISGVPDPAALLRVISLRAGDPYDADEVQADLERLRALPGIARAAVDMQTGDEGVSLVFRVVPTGALMSPSDAQRAGGVIAEVRVRGNRRIEDGAILARISSRAGEPFRTARLPGDLRDIHRLGFFRNVRVFSDQGPSGRVLIFEVEENPVVRQVTITGNDKIDGEQIRDNLTLTTGSTLDLPLLFENKQRIEAIYRAEGYYLASVQHEIEDLTTGSVAINFVVDEGKKLRLRKVEFVGNEAFSDAELKEEFKTRTWRWHSPVTRFFNKAGTYSEPIFHQDLRTVSDLYFDNGYIQAEVSDPEVTPSRKGLSVVVRIAEGPQFRVRDVDASGDRTVDVEDMRRSLALRAEDIFSRSSLNDDVERLEHRYTDRGFYAAEVKPRTRVDESENRVDVTFEVEKGPLFFLREIEVAGNSQTVDPVVRREMRMVEGELYSERAVDISRRRIEVLGFFEEVAIEPKTTDYESQLDLDVRVVERPTGSLSFGAGYSSRDKFVLSGSISQSNLFGRGYGGSLSADLGGRSRRYSISFSDPYFLDTTFGFSAQTFLTSVEFTNSFNVTTNGAQFVLSHLLDNAGFTRVFLQYAWTNREVTGLSGAGSTGSYAAPLHRQSLSGSQATSLLGLRVLRDTRNDRINPTAGMITDNSLDFAGLGGFTKYARLESRAIWYKNNPRWVPDWLPSKQSGTWVFAGRFGWAVPFNSIGNFRTATGQYMGSTADLQNAARLEEIDTDIELPLTERYFLGGLGAYQLRGFDQRSVGPRRAKVRRVAANTVRDDLPDTEYLYRPANAAGGICDSSSEECNSLSDRELSDFAEVGATDVIGGNKFISGTLEYRFPLSVDLGMIGIAFADIGNAFAEGESVLEFDRWRMSTGFGLLWFSPFGPLQAFLGFPLDRYDHEGSSVFEFSIGGQIF